MSTANRFEIETLACQRQAEIEYQLRLSAEIDDHRPAKGAAAMKVNFRMALIIAVMVGLILLLATGLSFIMVYALAVVH